MTKQKKVDRENLKEIDARVLGQIMAAQNILFVLPTRKNIAEFFAKSLSAIPGVSSCRVCIGNSFSQEGILENKACDECQNIKFTSEEDHSISKNFICRLKELSDSYVFALETLDNRFGFFIFSINQIELFELYKPFICNLGNFVALYLENQLQRNALLEASFILEEKIKERTAELQSVNIYLEEEIEERIRTEDSLRESEENFKFLFNTMVQGVIVQDAESKILNANNAASQILGLSTDQLLGKTAYDPRWKLIHEDGSPLYPEEMPSNIAIRTFQPVTDILIGAYIPKQNTYHWILTSSTPKFKVGSNTPYLTMTTFSNITERKKVEENLKNSEKKYRTLAETIPDNIVRYDKDGHVIYMNTRIQETINTKFEDFRNLLPTERNRDTLPKGAYDKYEQNLFEVLKTGKVIEFEFLVPDLLPKEEIHLLKMVPEYNETGEIIGAMTVGRDITERKKAEEKLQESEERFRLLFEQSPISIWVEDFTLVINSINELKQQGITDLNDFFATNPDGFSKITDTIRYLSVNQATLNLYKAESKDELYNRLTETYTEELSNLFKQFLVDIWNGKNFMSGEAILQTFDGVRRNIVVNLSLMSGLKQQTNVIISLSDITEQKQYSQKIELLSSALNNASESILISEAGSSNYIYVNDAACHSLEYTRKELLKLSPFDFDPDLTKETLNYLVQKVRQDNLVTFERRHKTKSGRFFPVEISYSIYKHNDKNYNMFVVRDISDRKNAEEEIHKLNHELEQRVAERTNQLEATNKELEAFAYSVSHDLRAPLRSIDGFSLILLEDYYDKIDEHGQNYLKRVRSATQRMAKLIDDMLDLSRVSRTEMNIQQINLSAIVQTIAEELRETQPTRMVEFNIQQGIMVQGDGQLLRIVLENLLGNAWKFTSKHLKAQIGFGSQMLEEKLVYYVRDDGAGFDMDYAQKLFGAFQRLHTTNEFPGTGIGLATVQRVIHRHGGIVWSVSEVEKGATFYFTINNK